MAWTPPGTCFSLLERYNALDSTKRVQTKPETVEIRSKSIICRALFHKAHSYVQLSHQTQQREQQLGLCLTGMTGKLGKHRALSVEKTATPAQNRLPGIDSGFEEHVWLDQMKHRRIQARRSIKHRFIVFLQCLQLISVTFSGVPANRLIVKWQLLFCDIYLCSK